MITRSPLCVKIQTSHKIITPLQIEKIENLSTLVNLETLDLSFNRIGKIENLDQLTNLKTLYLVHNKISKIEGLDKVRPVAIF